LTVTMKGLASLQRFCLGTMGANAWYGNGDENSMRARRSVIHSSPQTGFPALNASDKKF
jgi:hypothetical protein